MDRADYFQLSPPHFRIPPLSDDPGNGSDEAAFGTTPVSTRRRSRPWGEGPSINRALEIISALVAHELVETV